MAGDYVLSIAGRLLDAALTGAMSANGYESLEFSQGHYIFILHEPMTCINRILKWTLGLAAIAGVALSAWSWNWVRQREKFIAKLALTVHSSPIFCAPHEPTLLSNPSLWLFGGKTAPLILVDTDEQETEATRLFPEATVANNSRPMRLDQLVPEAAKR